MGKIFDNIDKEIQTSMIESYASSREKTEVLRAIKAEFLKAKTEKNAKPLDDNREIQIIQKMVKQRQESAEIYKANNRLDLSVKELLEIKILQEFLPVEITKEQIESEVLNCNIELIKSNMGSIIKLVKSKYPTADGKLVADIVKSYLI